MPTLDLTRCGTLAYLGRIVIECAHLGRVAWQAPGNPDQPPAPPPAY